MPCWTNAHTHTHIYITHRVKLDIALGLIMNTRKAKYLTPRLLVYAQCQHTHTQECVHHRLTQASQSESEMAHYAAALLQKQIWVLDTPLRSNRCVRTRCHCDLPSSQLVFLHMQHIPKRTPPCLRVQIDSMVSQYVSLTVSALRVKPPVGFEMRTISIRLLR